MSATNAHEDAEAETAMGKMRLDRPKSAAMRPSASAAAILSAKPAGAGAAAPEVRASKQLYNLNMGAGAAAVGIGSRPFNEESDESDEEEAGVVSAVAPATPRGGAEGEPARRTLTTSSSSVLMPRKGGKPGALETAAVLGRLPAAQAEMPLQELAQPAAAPPDATSAPAARRAAGAPAKPPAAAAGPSDAVINARLQNARQRIKQQGDTEAARSWDSGVADKGGTRRSQDEATSSDDDDDDAPRAAPLVAHAAAKGAGAASGARAASAGGRDEPPPPAAAPRPAVSAAELAASLRAHGLEVQRDLRGWLASPAPRGVSVQCYIRREKSLGLDMLYPQYRCYLQTPDGDRFVMAARKRKKSHSNNYVLSVDQKDLARHSSSCIGKLRSNFVGTEFVLYDDGHNPLKLPKDCVGGKDKEGRGVRRELASCLNTQNVIGAPSPRKVRALIPQIVDGKPMVYCPTSDEQTMLARDKDGRLGTDFVQLASKSPRYNAATGKYSLNFNGRVKVASVKNVQLVLAGEEETVIMQFGKTGKNDFILDFQYPLTPMQAFAFGLTSLAYKLANEGG